MYLKIVCVTDLVAPHLTDLIALHLGVRSMCRLTIARTHHFWHAFDACSNWIHFQGKGSAILDALVQPPTKLGPMLPSSCLGRPVHTIPASHCAGQMGLA